MQVHRSDDADSEQVSDALIDGAVVLVTGTARAALRHRDFRVFWSGVFASNIGTWMQNVLLGAYGFVLTHSAGYVGLLAFAQLGPLLFLSTVSGVLADTLDRRRLLVTAQLVQLALALVLAGLALGHHPSPVAIFLCVLAIGIANAMGGPGMSAIMPSLVPREDLSGAVALASVQMNLSRVIGPPIAALIYSRYGASPVFAINALTYLAAVYSLLAARYPRRVDAVITERGLARLMSGFRVASADRLVRLVLVVVFTFSFISLNFIPFMSVLAVEHYGISPKSTGYGMLYACFGLGAACGAVSVGSVFAHRPKAELVRPGLAAFAVLLALFGLLRVAAAAFPVAFVLGYAYFVVITSLSTVLQEHVEDAVRGRVMALWIMGFGGAVGVGALVWGPVAHHSIGALLVVGAAWALVLSALCAPARLYAGVRHA
jgi:MFS family permease